MPGCANVSMRSPAYLSSIAPISSNLRQDREPDRRKVPTSLRFGGGHAYRTMRPSAPLTRPMISL